MSADPRLDRNGKSIDLAEEADFPLGTLYVKPSSREVVADGTAETLEPRVMQVLVALARRPGEVVSRDQLVELCWAGRTVSEDALNRSMTRVRRLSSAATFTLDTIPRVGYRLTPAPVVLEPAEQGPLPSGNDAPTPIPPPPKSRRRFPWIAVGIVVAIFLAAAMFGTWQSLVKRPFFAVLPFEVLGSDPDAAFLAEAIPTAISGHLTSQGYKVISPAVSFQYRGERKAAVAEELAPRYIIDGSVRIEGGRVLVTTRIDSALEPVSIWSQDFEADVSDVRGLPDVVATALAGMFNPGLPAIFENPPEITAALMRIGSRQRAGDEMGAYVATRELMRRAPTNLTVRINSMTATGAVLDRLSPSERQKALAEARVMGEAVAEEAWGGAPMALYPLIPPIEWNRREALLRKGLENEYTDASSLRRTLALHLGNSGRLIEAFAMSQQALGVHGLSIFNVTTHTSILDSMGRLDDAETLLVRAERLWPANEFVERARFSVALAREDFNAAGALLNDPKVGPVVNPQAERRPLAAIVRALQTLAPADIAEVESECADPSKLARERGRFCLHALVLLGRLDSFFGLTQRYFPEQRAATPAQRDALWLADPRAITHVRVLFRQDMRAIRADARFIPIVERMGLLDYWRETDKWPDFCNTEPESVCGRMREKKSL